MPDTMGPWGHEIMGPWVHGLHSGSSLARQPLLDLGSWCRLTARDEHTLKIHKPITIKALYVLSWYTLLLRLGPWDHGGHEIMGPWVHGLHTGSSLTRYQNMTSGVGFHQICCQANNKQLIFVGLSGREIGLKLNSHQTELITADTI